MTTSIIPRGLPSGTRSVGAMRDWMIYAALLLVLLPLVRMEQTRPNGLQDILPVRCAGQMLLTGVTPYGDRHLRSICGPQTLDFFYPPFVARAAATTVSWLGPSGWMVAFDICLALSCGLVIGVAISVLRRKHTSLIAVLTGLALLLGIGGGVLVTGMHSGNIAVLFWGALTFAIFAARSPRWVALVIMIGVCIKFYLIYLLAIPVLGYRDGWRPALLAAGGAVLFYWAQMHFEPTLFADYMQRAHAQSQIIGSNGSSTLQLGAWIAMLTGAPLLPVQLLVVLGVTLALVWRGRHLLRMLLVRRKQPPDATSLQAMALLLLLLAVLSPRVTSYDLLILMPVTAVLIQRQRTELVVGCIVAPWACRLMLALAALGPWGAWLKNRYGLDYSALWDYYMFATWLCVSGYTWVTLARERVTAIVTAGEAPLDEQQAIAA